MTPISVFKIKTKLKKLMSVLATSMLVTAAKKKDDETTETFGTAETAETARVGKDSKYPRTNLLQISCI